MAHIAVPLSLIAQRAEEDLLPPVVVDVGDAHLVVARPVVGAPAELLSNTQRCVSEPLR